MNKQKLYGLFEGNYTLRTPTNEEITSHPLGVIGVVEGTHFVPNGLSRNERYYGSEVWVKQLGLKKIIDKQAEHRMLGTVGHDLEITDIELREGIPSHYTTDLDPETGFGRSFILDTKVGNILLKYLQAEVNLYVSSRADGSYKGKQGKYPKLDPDTFDLERFDFVFNPGFLEANPKLVESIKDENYNLIEKSRLFLEKDDKSKKVDDRWILDDDDKGDSTMTKKKDGDDTQSQAVEALLQKNEDLINANAGLTLQLESKEPSSVEKAIGALGGLDQLKSKLESLDTFIEEVGELSVVKEQLEGLATFVESCGDLKLVENTLDSSSSFFEEVGSAKEIKEHLTAYHELLIANESGADVSESLELSNKIVEELGSLPENVVEVLRVVENLGGLEDVKEAFTAIAETLAEHGSPVALVEKNEALSVELSKANSKSEALELSIETGIDSEKIVERMDEGLSLRACREYYEMNPEVSADNKLESTNEDISPKKQSFSEKLLGHSEGRVTRILNQGKV